MSIKHARGDGFVSGCSYFNNYTTTNAYVQISFGFPAKRLSIVNDSDSDPVQVSWDNSTLHYQLAGAEYKDIAADGRTSVYIKATAGGEKARVSAE